MKIYRISPHSEDDQVYIDFETALDWDFISNVLDGVKVSEGDVNDSMRLKDKNRVVSRYFRNEFSRFFNVRESQGNY